jgi:hypothetical protein
MCDRTNVDYSDCDVNLKEFLRGLFAVEPLPPLTYEITLPVIEDDVVRVHEFLAYVCVLGARDLYGRQLGELTVDEINHLRKYLRSIGWDADYKVGDLESIITTDGVANSVRKYLIDFYPVI